MKQEIYKGRGGRDRSGNKGKREGKKDRREE